MTKEEKDDGLHVSFENMAEFHNFIMERGLHLLSEPIRKFYDVYGGLGGGCGCSKKTRTNSAIRLYLQVPKSLDDHRRFLLHRVLSEGESKPTKRIVFKHDGKEFDNIEFVINN